MSDASNLVWLRVWGDLACFTRPEMKVERVSYPLPTPSAARGILEAVFWEPQMFYLIDSIRVLKRGTWISIRRNEVQSVISTKNVAKWMKEPTSVKPIRAGGGAPDGTQRNMLALQKVEYILAAEIHTTALDMRPDIRVEKYIAEFSRRASMGKCFHRPGLGMREFAADFDWVEDPTEFTTADWNADLGLMLYDVFDHRQRCEGFRWLRSEEAVDADSPPPPRKGRGRRVAPRGWKGAKIKPAAAFFHAGVSDGVKDCHPDRVKIHFQNDGGQQPCS